MPTNTFFRLPEEKRQRLLDAAWGEFTRVSYVDVSINRIIQQAHIPRGSFYQYFSDKEELFYYLLEDVRSYFANLLGELLEETRGDLFAMTLAAFDRLVRRDGDVEETVDRCLQVMRRNQGMDIRILEDGERLLPDELAGQPGFAYRHLPLSGGVKLPHEEELVGWGYFQMLERKEEVAAVLAAIADAPGGVLFPTDAG